MLLLIILICNYYHESLIPWNHWSLGVCSFSYKCFSFSICILSFNCFTLFYITLFWSPVNHYLEWELALKQTVPQIYLVSLCVVMTLCWTEKKPIRCRFRFIIRVLLIIFENCSWKKNLKIYSYCKSTDCIFEGPQILERPGLLHASWKSFLKNKTKEKSTSLFLAEI